MQAVVCWCLVALAQVSGSEHREWIDVDRSVKATWGASCQREAIILCVHLGIGPVEMERVFGPPLLTSQFRDGPVEWWYPQMGVTVKWPAKLFELTGPMKRAQGGIG